MRFRHGGVKFFHRERVGLRCTAGVCAELDVLAIEVFGGACKEPNTCVWSVFKFHPQDSSGMRANGKVSS